MGNVGCKSAAAVHFSPSFCRIAELLGCKYGKNYPRWGQFSLSTPQARQAPRRLSLVYAGFVCIIFSLTLCAMPTQYTISELAKEFDLTTRAIRFYEDMDLIHPERVGPGGRNRVYTARDRARLKLTLRAKRLGLSLNDAKEILDVYDSPRDTGPQLEKFLAILAGHRRQLEAQMGDIQANLDELRAHEKEALSLLKKVNAPK